MKKLFSFFATAALAFGFTACEDVPAPYEVNGGGNPSIPGQENTIFSTEFDGGATDGFTFSNVSMNGLSYVWTCDASYGYLKASAYAGGACHAAESWAVSPAINLSDCTWATLTFRHAINKIDNTDLMPTMMTVWVCTDYAGNAATASWSQLTVPTYPSGTSWTFVGSDDIDLADFCGNDKVYIGFKYISTEQNAGSWEVDAFKVVGDGTPMSGGDTPDDPDTPDNPVIPTPSGDNLLSNGGFETWSSATAPDGWKSASTASNATLSQSTDAHSGTYSVKVGGATSANKRLGSAELTLKAGTYSMNFFAKAATTDGGSVRPGYVPVTDGKVGSYVYGEYTNNLSNTAWTEVNHTFTLAEQTTVSIVVMNSKNPGKDVLIDDFTLTTSDGGVVGGNGGEQPGDTPSASTLSWDFIALGGQGGWTVDNKLMPSDLSYIWTFDSKYGMKASAFANSTNYDTESWLISPELDLSALSTATLTINHAGKFFGSIENEAQVKISADGTNWTSVTLSDYPTSWTFVEATADISALAGKKGARIALVYSSTSAAAGTWEVDKVSIK